MGMVTNGNGVSAWTNAMGAMATRRPWQNDALETCHGSHCKKHMTALKGIFSGPHGAS